MDPVCTSGSEPCRVQMPAFVFQRFFILVCLFLFYFFYFFIFFPPLRIKILFGRKSWNSISFSLHICPFQAWGTFFNCKWEEKFSILILFVFLGKVRGDSTHDVPYHKKSCTSWPKGYWVRKLGLVKDTYIFIQMNLS